MGVLQYDRIMASIRLCTVHCALCSRAKVIKFGVLSRISQVLVPGILVESARIWKIVILTEFQRMLAFVAHHAFTWV